jgi:hypothetical protein
LSFSDPSGSQYFGGASIANGTLFQGNSDGTLFAFGV